ncbi:MAG TPA: hypothetical protein VJT31_28575 [Rugosimonospora sp.]|nr:hypothetical protein [Rugosimonospora sp.]
MAQPGEPDDLPEALNAAASGDLGEALDAARGGGSAAPSDVPVVTGSRVGRWWHKITRVDVLTLIVAIVAIVVPLLWGSPPSPGPQDHVSPGVLPSPTAVRPPVTATATMNYTASCSGVRVWGAWSYRYNADQLDVEVDGVVIGAAVISPAGDYDSTFYPRAGSCQWPGIDGGTADLSTGRRTHTIRVWSIWCRDPGCAATKNDTFTSS